MYKQLFRIFFKLQIYMTKKYKLIKAIDNTSNITTEQYGGRGYTVTMPMSPFSTQFSTVIPALPSIPQSILPGFSFPMNKMTQPINLFPPNKNQRVFNLLNEMTNLAKETGTALSDDLPSHLSDTDAESGKWYMTRNNTNSSNILVNETSYNSKKYFTGAGVIVIETDSAGQNVILFADKNNNMFQDAGGSIESGDFDGANTLLNTAKRELAEESCNSFNLSTSTVNYVDLDRYRCYIVVINKNKFTKANYNSNRDKIFASSLPSSWKETNAANTFSVTAIRNTINSNSISNSNLNCQDTTGASKIIRGRTIGVLRALLNSDKYNAIIGNVKTTNVRTNATLTDGLKDTITLEIVN